MRDLGEACFGRSAEFCDAWWTILASSCSSKQKVQEGWAIHVKERRGLQEVQVGCLPLQSDDPYSRCFRSFFPQFSLSFLTKPLHPQPWSQPPSPLGPRIRILSDGNHSPATIWNRTSLNGKVKATEPLSIGIRTVQLFFGCCRILMRVKHSSSEGQQGVNSSAAVSDR